MEYTTTAPVDDDDGDGDTINYRTRVGFLQAAHNVQHKSKEYWLFEYLSRQKEKLDAGNEARFEATVLGCVDPRRFQYAIYVHELGLEHRYLSEMGSLRIGETVWLRVVSTSPRHGLLTFWLAKTS